MAADELGDVGRADTMEVRVQLPGCLDRVAAAVGVAESGPRKWGELRGPHFDATGATATGCNGGKGSGVVANDNRYQDQRDINEFG